MTYSIKLNSFNWLGDERAATQKHIALNIARDKLAAV